ncbi:hypothetical protein Mlute_00034 [Meiothermus luteus]|jgi:hypothetical protein|uniref:Uncharacterized protein n=1 Tax=Meiothermus luteus TaxID=2026184 RepID=A0A399F5H1_9DEIN|nr:hypothetical protein Mlute_00034 [Meiothermus luteus]
MPRKRSWYRLEAHRLREVLERLSLKDGLLLWEALGEDPGAFPLGNPEARRQAMHRIKRDRVSQGIAGNPVTKCHTPLRAGERKPLAKREKPRDKVSQENKRNKAGSRYPDPAGSLAQELGGWRAGLLYRARKEQNALIQRLAQQHKESLLELLNLVESLPLAKRVPTTLAWLEEFASEIERLGDEAVRQVLLEVRKKAPDQPLLYARRVLAGRGKKEEKTWTATGEQF